MMNRLTALLISLLVPTLAFGQGYAASGAAPEKAVELNLKGLAVGFGSFFDDESVTFSTTAMYAAVQYHAVGFGFVEDGLSTGFQFESRVGRLNTIDLANGRLQFLDNFQYRFWSITRVPVSAIPIAALDTGILGNMFTGVDFVLTERIVEDDPFKGRDKRLVVGGDLGKLGIGHIVLEIYSLQDNVPISFAVFYGF